MTNMQSAKVLYPPLDDDNNDPSGQNDPDSANVLPPRLSSNFQILKKRKLTHAESQKLALETAQLVHDEVSRLKNSIKELEAVLNGTQHGDISDDEEFDDIDEEDDGGAHPDVERRTVNVVEDGDVEDDDEEEPCAVPLQVFATTHYDNLDDEENDDESSLDCP